MVDLALRSKANEWLTLDQMRASLPAIFAEEAHSSRSSRYVYISTADMLGELMKADFVPVEARVSRTRIEDKQGFAKHMIRLRSRRDFEQKSTRRVGDTSFEVILRNAHDGSGSYRFMAGLLKLICLNGMVVSDGTIDDVKVLHTGNRQRQLEAVVGGAETILDQGPRLIDTVRSWQGVQLSSDERDAYAQSAHHLRFANAQGVVDTAIKPAQLLVPRRSEDQRTDLWTTFNVVQENAIRGGLSAMGRNAQGRPHRTTTREVKGIDGDIKLNRALWALTEKMAELKG